MGTESRVAAADAGALDLPDRERNLFVRRIRLGQGMEDLERLRPSRLAIPAKDQGGLQHAGLPVIRRDPQDIVDCGCSLVVRARDFWTVLELDVVVDLAVQQVQATCFAGVVRDSDRLREVDDRIQFAGLRVLGQFGLRFRGEDERGIELAALEGRLRLRHFCRGHVFRGIKGAVALRLPPVRRDEPSSPDSRSAAEMEDADAFDGVAFLGMARSAKRDPYRLSLFGAHLDSGERPLVLLPVQGGTLLVTDLRILEFRAHLEVHGAWNVKEFQGYMVQRSIDRASVREIEHVVRGTVDTADNRRVEDQLQLTTSNGLENVLVSRGPEPTLSDADFAVLRDAVLGRQAK